MVVMAHETRDPGAEHTCHGGMNPPFPGPCAACERERAAYERERASEPQDVEARLREISEVTSSATLNRRAGRVTHTCREAADALAAMTAERDALRAEVARLHELLADAHAVIDPEAHHELDTRLVAALDESNCPPECDLRNELAAERARREQAEAALRKLVNEAVGFLALADRETHGNTNIAVLQLRIDEARKALGA